MELLQLKYFCALADTQHVTRTAEHLHIAQPSLTQTIHRLENELGVKLFASSGRNIVLTEYGEYLKRKADPIVKALSEIPEEIKEMSGERGRLLRINLLSASNLTTEAIISYQKQHSAMRFQIVRDNDSDNADITVFTREAFTLPKNVRDRYYIFTEQIYLAVAANSQYADAESIPLSTLRDSRYIAVAGYKGFRSICDRLCMNAGFKPDVIFESDSTSAVRNLIAADMGVGFWPQYTWDNYDENALRLIPISDPVCKRDIVIQLHGTALEHPRAAEFFDHLISVFEHSKVSRSTHKNVL